MRKNLIITSVILVFCFLFSFFFFACSQREQKWGPEALGTQKPVTPTPTPIPNKELEEALLESTSPDLPAPIATWAVECTTGKGVKKKTELFLLTEDKVLKMGGSQKIFVLLPNGKHLVFDENYKPLDKSGCTLKRLVMISSEPEGDGMGKIPEILPPSK